MIHSFRVFVSAHGSLGWFIQFALQVMKTSNSQFRYYISNTHQMDREIGMKEIREARL